ncbi:MAG: acyltransferase [Bacteroidia bacterium]|nr:acyltransferase [Bacteroidia bacterium]
MIKTDIDKHQSDVINAMRFPLIVLVLYMHIVPLDSFPVEIGFSGMHLYNFLAEFISHNVGRLAVPCFFLFSGYFYFRKMGAWSSGFYLLQQKKRVVSLIIPYILWNLLNILVVLAKGYAMNIAGLDGSGDINFIRQTPFLELMVMPINLPLWYLRDLICMTFFAPLFYYLFNYTKIWGLLAILILYLTTWELPFRGFSMTAIFYFGLGAFWGINKKNMLESARKIKYPALIFGLALALVATFLSTTVYHEYLIRWFAPLGVASAFIITDFIVRKQKIREVFLKYSPAVFFIYAVHELYLKNWVKGAFYRTPLSESGWGMVLGYIVMPLILLAICLALYFILKKLWPRALNVLSGGR